ncbi:MAG: hypothetical protein MZV70_63170 [Desulfobacterales bacterium]|nr:hypothetical protein [Desulfobacterales bacterium]
MKYQLIAIRRIAGELRIIGRVFRERDTGVTYMWIERPWEFRYVDQD